MVSGEADRLKKVIVCAPHKEYFHVSNLKEHNIAETAGVEKAQFQHTILRQTMSSFGAEVMDIPELKGHPNSVFTRDTAVVTSRGFIRLRMGLETRLEEEHWMAGHLQTLGVPEVGIIPPSGTVEGGDIILAGNTAFLGHSLRSNSSGVKHLSQLLKSMDYELRVWDVPLPHLHLGGMMSLIAPDMVLCCSGIFPPEYFKGFRRVEVPCSTSVTGNVICMGDGKLIVEKRNHQAAEKLDKEGFQVHSLDFSEFVKGRGGPTCLILPVERE